MAAPPTSESSRPPLELLAVRSPRPGGGLRVRAASSVLQVLTSLALHDCAGVCAVPLSGFSPMPSGVVGSNETRVESEARQLVAAGDAELGKDVVHMGFKGLHRDVQPR